MADSSDAEDPIARERALRMAAEGQVRHADRLATAGRLAAGLAHEIGTPLGVVRMHAQMLGSGEVPAQDIPPVADAIVEQCDRMMRLLRRLLDFARPHTGVAEAVDLTALTRSTLVLVRAPASKGRVELVPPAAGVPIVAMADRNEYQQVLLNLAVNGVHAMPDGGVLTVELRRERRATPGHPADRPSEWAVLTVSDTGVGLDDAALSRVFEPFYSTKEPELGSGLGLAVSEAIVADHGGWIEVRSTLGVGTTFEVYFPAA